MYCPKCSQKQISEEVRFCSRCGFQMEGVIYLLANDGVLPGSGAADERRVKTFFRRATSTVGAKMIFSSVILFAITFFVAIVTDAPQLFVFPLLLFFAGLMQTAYVFIFGKTAETEIDKYAEKNLNPAQTRRNLPPIQSQPVSAYQAPAREETVMAQPPSVTEPTTKLFKSEGDTNDL